MLADGYVQVDETPINYLEPGNGKTKQGYLWTGSRPGGEAFYHWATSRAAACLELGSCRRHGLNPAEYLHDIFERLPTAKTSEVPALTPAAWAKHRRRQLQHAV